MKTNFLTKNNFLPQHQIKKQIYHSRLTYNQSHLAKFSSFPYKQKEQISQNTYLDNQSDIHDYDNFINPRRHSYNRYNFRPQPRKDYRLFLGENDIISLSQKSC